MKVAKTILLVSETGGHLATAIKTNLKDQGYNMLVVRPDVDEINEITASLDGIFICADGKLTREQRGLNFLKDRAIMNDTPIFVIGSKVELTAVRVIIPKDIITREFLRPTNIADIVDQVNKHILQYGKVDKKKILVVDDSSAMLRNVKTWLEDKYSISLVNSAAMAIKYLSLNRPDLILLDYEMPVVDGKQVLEMLRAEMDFSSIPVMFLTGKDDKDSIMKVMELKPEGYLLKSLDPELIVAAVDEFFYKIEETKRDWWLSK